MVSGDAGKGESVSIGRFASSLPGPLVSGIARCGSVWLFYRDGDGEAIAWDAEDEDVGGDDFREKDADEYPLPHHKEHHDVFGPIVLKMC